MKLTIKDTLKALLLKEGQQEAHSYPGVVVETTVISIASGVVQLSGVDGVTVPSKVAYTDGESKLSVGDILRLQLDTGLVESRKVFAAPEARARNGSGSPDYSMKSQGI